MAARIKTFEWETQLRLFPYKAAEAAELEWPAMHRWTDMSSIFCEALAGDSAYFGAEDEMQFPQRGN